ncbi:MAG: hypothetical protein JXA21_02095 [Anaerolineae bacterium]|nr:hypothetical protein [Anaerolineae bacterium]
MPTPFQHLVYARMLLGDPALPAAVRENLHRESHAYYLGNTAADVQSITTQPRCETHFYHLVDLAKVRPYAVMLATWPYLADPYQLTPAHAAFVSGYLAHLVWDEFWAREIFVPYYMENDGWVERLECNIHHNALRVCLDQQAEAVLRTWESPACLIQDAIPEHWLPFVTDAALCRWRDWLVAQLWDPAKVETSQVFADRMGIPVEQLQEMIQIINVADDPAPTPGLREALVHFEQRAWAESLNVLTRYWEGMLQEDASAAASLPSPACQPAAALPRQF